MDERTRFILGAVARGEVFRDLAGTDRRWIAGSNSSGWDGTEPLDGEARQILAGLEQHGLIALPEFPDFTRGERRWDLTAKALEG